MPLWTSTACSKRTVLQFTHFTAIKSIPMIHRVGDRWVMSVPKMRTDITSVLHVTEDDLELYAMRRFDEIAGLDAVDLHLLKCNECQRDLVWIEQFLGVLRTTLLEMESTGEQATSTTPVPPTVPSLVSPRPSATQPWVCSRFSSPHGTPPPPICRFSSAPPRFRIRRKETSMGDPIIIFPPVQ